MSLRARTILLYLLLVGIPILAVIVLIDVGRAIVPPKLGGAALETAAAPAGTPTMLLLIGQIAVIIALSRVVALLLTRLKQPRVVSEIAAGLLLGPSLLGAVAPILHAGLFPVQSLGILGMLSQIGAVLFMFLVGLQFDPQHLQGRKLSTMVISHVGIAFPFVLGIALAFYLYAPLAPAGVDFVSFALFLGAAMSVTALPVLARILGERGLQQTRVGVVALGCAAIGDATAWLILAGVVILVRSGSATTPLWATVIGVFVFCGLAVFGLRPWLARLHTRVLTRSWLSQDSIGLLLLLVLAFAMIAERLGIHALFGAFLAGAIIPKNAELVRELSRRMEDFTVVFLLPLFFAYTGLRTDFNLLQDPGGWVFIGLITAVAIAGKAGGSTLTARMTGMSWRDATAIGVLMNTRGLMELVILNIGLDIGVISPALFSMMVVMALLTTAMTTPLLGLIMPAGSSHAGFHDGPPEALRQSFTLTTTSPAEEGI